MVPMCLTIGNLKCPIPLPPSWSFAGTDRIFKLAEVDNLERGVQIFCEIQGSHPGEFESSENLPRISIRSKDPRTARKRHFCRATFDVNWMLGGEYHSLYANCS